MISEKHFSGKRKRSRKIFYSVRFVNKSARLLQWQVFSQDHRPHSGKHGFSKGPLCVF